MSPRMAPIDPHRQDEPALEPLEQHLDELDRVAGRVHRASKERPAWMESTSTRLDDLAVLDDVFRSFGFERSEVAAIVRPFRPFAIAATISIVGSAVAPQAPWILIVPALFGIVGLLADRRISFTFADGLIGYRGDGRPRGIQEEYDVTWSRPGAAGTATVGTART